MYSVLIAISRSDSPSVILPVTTMTLIRSSCWVSSSHNIPLLLLPTFLQNNNLVNWSTIAYQGWKTWIRLPVVRYCGPHLIRFFSLFNLTLLKLTFKMFVWQIIEGSPKCTVPLIPPIHTLGAYIAWQLLLTRAWPQWFNLQNHLGIPPLHQISNIEHIHCPAFFSWVLVQHH